VCAACQEAPSKSAVEPARPTTRSLTLETGPLLIDRLYRSMDGPFERLPVNPESLDWITAYRTTVLDSDTGDRMGDEFFCHSQLQLSNHVRLLVTATGSEDIVFPEGFGMPLSQIVGDIPDPEWRALTVLGMVLNNHDPTMHRNTRVRVSLDYLTDQEARDRGLRKLYKVEVPMTVQPAPGEPPEVVHGGEDCVLVAGLKSHWLVDPGPLLTRKRYQGLFPVDATVHFANAHLHNHGVFVRLVDLTAGKELWRTDVEYEPSRRQIQRIPEYASQSGFPVFKDHEYEIEAYYENTSDGPIDAMAAIYLYYHPTTDVDISYPYGPEEGIPIPTS
jgi:hypothetical protein